MEILLLLMVAVRVTIVYAFLFVVVRLLGKRHLGIHSAFDLVVAIIMADLASEAIFGTVTLLHSLFAVGVIAVWHYTGRFLGYRYAGTHPWLTVKSRVLVRDGAIIPHALRAERLPESDLWSMLHEHGVEELDEVKLATLEPSGRLSVVRQEWARDARKADVTSILEREQA